MRQSLDLSGLPNAFEIHTSPNALADAARALHKACESGNVDEVDRMMSLDEKTARKLAQHPVADMTALQAAAEAGQARCVEALLPHSNPNSATNSGETALMLAAQQGHLDCVLALLPVSDPNARCREERTALMKAVFVGNAPCVEALLPRSDTSRPDAWGKTLLMHAAASGDSETLRLMLPFGDPHARDRDGSTALMLAATGEEAGSAECIRILLPLSDVKAADSVNHDTALMTSAQIGNVESVLALLPHSDPNAINADGRSALAFAAAEGNEACVRALVPLTCRHECDMALIDAAQYKQPGCVRELIPHADPKAVRPNGTTALMWAINQPNPFQAAARDECIALLAPISDVNHQTPEGDTALKEALAQGPRITDLVARFADSDGRRLALDKFSADKLPQTYAAHEREVLSQLLHPGGFSAHRAADATAAQSEPDEQPHEQARVARAEDFDASRRSPRRGMRL
ncbi:ankyrin repeat domain-containing protein [Burkholderia vietnamiensis]|uniref:Uncharacterized protein n=1 Tax=Burkholderia vietnamiensis (strain G4 / LMG 22486) TaxID=269482 RepID=A4JFS6_BURVG|nr:hypothetical protein Bcep1808_2127 [Burkholderia vietnamiensis G4]MCB4344885.1 ankyrin repeat domain-containing protein [Burkholderia vietnamiensis]